MGKFKNESIGFELDDERIKDYYLSWLGRIIGVNSEEDTWNLLIRCLHSLDYKWSVPNDDNRGADGNKLRDMFVDQHGYGPYEQFILNDGPDCTVLEMMIGMSVRMDEMMEDPQREGRPGEFFWEMIQNIGLGEFSDYNYLFVGGNLRVKITINGVLSREYDHLGRGGFFPLEHTDNDQRNVELWYQMNAYLRDRYCIEC